MFTQKMAQYFGDAGTFQFCWHSRLFIC